MEVQNESSKEFKVNWDSFYFFKLKSSSSLKGNDEKSNERRNSVCIVERVRKYSFFLIICMASLFFSFDEVTESEP